MRSGRSHLTSSFLDFPWGKGAQNILFESERLGVNQNPHGPHSQDQVVYRSALCRGCRARNVGGVGAHAPEGGWGRGRGRSLSQHSSGLWLASLKVLAQSTGERPQRGWRLPGSRAREKGGSGACGALTGSLAVLNPIRAGRTQQVGRSRSVSGETLHLRPGELEGGGINRCCFQGRA